MFLFSLIPLIITHSFLIENRSIIDNLVFSETRHCVQQIRLLPVHRLSFYTPLYLPLLWLHILPIGGQRLRVKFSIELKKRKITSTHKGQLVFLHYAIKNPYSKQTRLVSRCTKSQRHLCEDILLTTANHWLPRFSLSLFFFSTKSHRLHIWKKRKKGLKISRFDSRK